MSDQYWHNDGHKITLQINRAEIEVLHIECPGGESECITEDYGCIVRWFIERFGMECNAGSCAPEEVLEICWTIVGNKRNIDAAQVWFMPMKDDVFAAWMISQSN
ncbi:hypothetical protein UFOVP658_4 [uncultured Caudovirales phage]|uniref:Uncharacterized protein n=1 Tax=uncultured Caudovirales phage TaxID=2100421 RepID=A0A6J5N9G0_9CAUD|nr:hypothetical protein UFOVP658_4 [uncultured Caudovirales phage]